MFLPWGGDGIWRREQMAPTKKVNHLQGTHSSGREFYKAGRKRDPLGPSQPLPRVAIKLRGPNVDGKVSSQRVHTALRGRVQAPGLCSGNKRSRLKGRKRQLPGGGDSQKESTNNQKSYPFCNLWLALSLGWVLGRRSPVSGLGRGSEEGRRKEEVTEKVKLLKAWPALSTPSRRPTIPSATNSYLPTPTAFHRLLRRN